VSIEGIEELNHLGYALYPGALGENLTIEGLDRREMRLGQRYHAGAAIIELTKMRAPCYQLDVYGPGIQERLFDKQVKSGNWTSPLWGLGGFYAAVVRSGRICPRDIIALVD
jgi:MOSC domain-containing protein YiiM